MRQSTGVEEPERVREEFHERVERLRGQLRQLKEFLEERGSRCETDRNEPGRSERD